MAAQRVDDLNRRPTQRAMTAAARTELGEWSRTVRVHRRADRATTSQAGMLFIAPVPFLGMAAFMDLPWYWLVPTLFAALLATLVGVVMLVLAVDRVRAGEALVHLFDRGMVLERVRGKLLALPYAVTEVSFVTWEETGSDSSRTWVAVWITPPDRPDFPAGYELKAWDDDEIRALELIAVHCELPPVPRPCPSRPRLVVTW